MNTSTEAVKKLEAAIETAQNAESVIAELVAPHDYQDVAQLLTRAGNSLLQAASLLMQKEAAQGLEFLDSAEELIDAVYDIIEADSE